MYVCISGLDLLLFICSLVARLFSYETSFHQTCLTRWKPKGADSLMLLLSNIWRYYNGRLGPLLDRFSDLGLFSYRCSMAAASSNGIGNAVL
jgi:hypothetical protein